MSTDYAAEIIAGRLLVIETDGAIVGYIICKSEPNAYLIENVAVHPMYQGKGYGRRLIERALAEARAAGFPTIRLYTNAAMTENLSLYRHLGFAETQRAITDGYHRVYMELELK
jgi:ribosomal protein S18 acetylase RimI-like enzyme